MSVVHRIPRGALLIALMAATAFALIMPIDAQIYAYSEDMEEINSISAGRVDVVELCSDQCAYSNSDDLCQDSGPNSLYNTCFLGTDCSDCGPQTYAMFPTLADAVSTFSNEDGVFEGYLFIYNTTLTSLEGMESVTGITGNFIVRNNRELSSIAALSNLTFVDGTLYFSDNALESTDGLESLTSVGYYFDLLQENNLLTMDIPSLVSVGAQLTLADNPNVTVTEFPRLTEVGTFEFNGFTNVERVLFPSLTRTETFFFSFFGKNPSEVDLGSLEYIDGDLYINDNSFVTSLDGLFDSLQIVNGSVYIYRNDALVSIDNFARLEIITDELYIADNPMLSSITGFGALESVGEVKIVRNPDLSSIAGLQQLSSVSECCYLNSTSLVEDLPACEGNLCADD